MTISFNTYYKYEELKEILSGLAEKFPKLMKISVIGQSYEKRDIVMVTLTNEETGPDTEKPAFWIDSNIHATEITGSAVALFLINRMLTEYGKDTNITRILDEQVMYILPRANPDGVEACLETPPKFVRSGTRPYPYKGRDEGLYEKDIDGDGRILQMRIQDKDGDWKVSEKNPLVMLKRKPYEDGGIYYRLFPEGLIEDYDGYTIKMGKALEGLDFNRNYPWAWRPEGQQPGAGDYPASEPEVQSMVKFITEHPNIYGAINYHTFSRVILRPFSNKPITEMDTEDRWTYETIGDIGTEITGYPNVAIYEDFKYHPKEIVTGTADDWLYEYKGIYAFVVELWDLPYAAGIEERSKNKNFIDWFRSHPEEDDYKIAEFIQKETKEGLVPWYEFDHPQLGKVELGGWNRLYTWRNPPEHLLEKELKPQTDFVISFAKMAPKLEWHKVEVTKIGDTNYHILAVLDNKGYLPTSVSNQAVKIKAVKPLEITLELPEGAKVTGGKEKQKVDHLQGRSNKIVLGYHATSSTDNRVKLEWVIESPNNGEVTIKAISERAGTIYKKIQLS